MSGGGERGLLSATPLTATANRAGYALALVIWEAFSHRVPFEELVTREAVRTAVLDGTRPPLSSASGMPERVMALLRRAWSNDPAQRPTAGEMLQVLESCELDGGDDV